MTLKELYEEACSKGWENLPVMAYRPGGVDLWGNKSLPTVEEAELVHRGDDFWPGLNKEFVAFV